MYIAIYLGFPNFLEQNILWLQISVDDFSAVKKANSSVCRMKECIIYTITIYKCHCLKMQTLIQNWSLSAKSSKANDCDVWAQNLSHSNYKLCGSHFPGFGGQDTCSNMAYLALLNMAWASRRGNKMRITMRVAAQVFLERLVWLVATLHVNYDRSPIGIARINSTIIEPVITQNTPFLCIPTSEDLLHTALEHSQLPVISLYLYSCVRHIALAYT